MSSVFKYTVIVLLAMASTAGRPALAQSKKFYAQPDIAAGLTGGYKGSNAMNLALGKKGAFVRLECRVGYYINNNLSVMTGFGFAAYRYNMYIDGASIESGHPDMIRDQQQSLLEMPLALRYTTYNPGLKQFKTRYYYGGGLRIGFLNDGRYDFRTVGAGPSGYEVRPGDFNKVHLRLFIEGGIDVPIDYNSAFLVGLNVAHGLTRNMSTGGDLRNSNYGLLAYGMNLGFRFGI